MFHIYDMPHTSVSYALYSTRTISVVQVDLYTAMYLHRPGIHIRRCWLRASKKFRGAERRHDVFVDCGGVQAVPYCAQLIVFFTCTYLGVTKKLALIRWYEAFGRVAVGTGCRIVKAEFQRINPSTNVAVRVFI
jgi:hypothetical protein